MGARKDFWMVLMIIMLFNYEPASRSRTACIAYACRPSLHRETLMIRRISRSCTMCECALLPSAVGGTGGVTVKICRFLELYAIVMRAMS